MPYVWNSNKNPSAMTDNTTPIQEAIYRIENGDPKYCTIAEIVEILESLLPKEKEFAEKCLNAGISMGLNVDLSETHILRDQAKTKFLNQLYPEK